MANPLQKHGYKGPPEKALKLEEVLDSHPVKCVSEDLAEKAYELDEAPDSTPGNVPRSDERGIRVPYNVRSPAAIYRYGLKIIFDTTATYVMKNGQRVFDHWATAAVKIINEQAKEIVGVLLNGRYVLNEVVVDIGETLGVPNNHLSFGKKDILDVFLQDP
ncbi:hypothetical protein A1F94_011997 [Pyrenophora tritici-repentis]|nr:hypothetical protein A1F94_011997 [Pyrenophora tritici-repentis]